MNHALGSAVVIEIPGSVDVKKIAAIIRIIAFISLACFSCATGNIQTLSRTPDEISPLQTASKNLKTTSARVGSEAGSPFGFHPARVAKRGYPDNGFIDAQNIGVRWAREGLYAFWFLIQPELGNRSYDFTLYDRQWGRIPTSMSILANISPQAPRYEGRCLPDSWLPVNEEEYIDFVEATVERYDGDGIADMPGLSNPITFWQVGNEPTNQRRSDFATLQKITYLAIKSACPDCTVLIGGVAGFPKGYISSFDKGYKPIIDELGGEYIDVFDFHWYGTTKGEYRMKDTATGLDVLDHIRTALTMSGFSKDLPIWITEMGAYSGNPSDKPPNRFPFQTEKHQAIDYFKRFIYPLSRGIEKVFPAFGLMEGFKHNDGYFDHTGLIYDGEYTDDLGLGERKLAYYTYKKMAEKLDGADWSTLVVIHDGTQSDHLYIFRVEKDGQPIHIAWWDYFDVLDYEMGDTITITLNDLSGAEVTVTDVVPGFDTGSRINDYETAFSVASYRIVEGAVTIPLGESPVLVE